MKKGILILAGCLLAGLLLAGCGTKQEDIREKMNDTPVVKLEWVEVADDPVFVWEPGAASVALPPGSRSRAATEEEWLYRITYFPEEYVSGTEEIVVEFGPTAMTIDGESYVPGEGVFTTPFCSGPGTNTTIGRYKTEKMGAPIGRSHCHMLC